jgi:hypothetical protein
MLTAVMLYCCQFKNWMITLVALYFDLMLVYRLFVGWSWLLSRKSLLKASKHLKEICEQCSLMYPNDVPCVLSACLVSLEPDSALRLMPDQFTPDERFSQTSVNCQLSTPHDVSCTHILVFPTSATSQVGQQTLMNMHCHPFFRNLFLIKPC